MNGGGSAREALGRRRHMRDSSRRGGGGVRRGFACVQYKYEAVRLHTLGLTRKKRRKKETRLGSMGAVEVARALQRAQRRSKHACWGRVVLRAMAAFEV